MSNNQVKAEENRTLRGNDEMREEEIDYNVMESFLASDPPSWTRGISPLKKIRSDFDGENLSADEPTHQNEGLE